MSHLNIDVKSLDRKTLIEYASKYLKIKRENNERQKKYYKSDVKKDVVREKSRRKYWEKKGVYHPIYNPECTVEGKKFKIPKKEDEIEAEFNE